MRIPLFGVLVVLFGVAGLVTFGAAAVAAVRQRQTLLAIGCGLAFAGTVVNPFVEIALTVRPVASRLSWELVGPLQSLANGAYLLVTAAFAVLAAIGTLRLHKRA